MSIKFMPDSMAVRKLRSCTRRRNGGNLRPPRYAWEIKAVTMLEPVGSLIHEVRGERVMLDSDLARVYGVATKSLNRAVKRNLGKFPPDFMFQLTPAEAETLRCQIGTSKRQLLRLLVGT